jgi:hypothetical protein
MGRYCHPVRRHGKEIVRRLRRTDVTVGQLQREYGCTYNTLRDTILSEIPPEEYQALMLARQRRDDKARMDEALGPAEVMRECSGCGALVPEETEQCPKCMGWKIETITRRKLAV